MSAVSEPFPVPPPEDRRTRFRLPIGLPPESRRQAEEETCNQILLWLDANLPLIAGSFGRAADKQIESCEWQYPVYHGSELIDFIDLHVVTCKQTLAFIVVPGRLSLRNVVRRIRILQAHEDALYVVVSPDARFADALRKQGIEFIEFISPELSAAPGGQ